MYKNLIIKLNRDSQKNLKKNLIKKYNRCIISDIHSNDCEVYHIIPISEGGNYNINNGLLLNIALHKSFDNYTWSINNDGVVVSKLKKLQMLHGDRYAPTEQLLDMEKRNKSFY